MDARSQSLRLVQLRVYSLGHHTQQEASVHMFMCDSPTSATSTAVDVEICWPLSHTLHVLQAETAKARAQKAELQRKEQLIRSMRTQMQTLEVHLVILQSSMLPAFLVGSGN